MTLKALFLLFSILLTPISSPLHPASSILRLLEVTVIIHPSLCLSQFHDGVDAGISNVCFSIAWTQQELAQKVILNTYILHLAHLLIQLACTQPESKA